MMRIALALVVVIACGCRRKHAADTYASDTPRTTPQVAAPITPTAPSGNAANPLNEPVLAPRDTRTLLPDGGTLNGDPRGPRAAVWQSLVDGVMPALQACFDRAELPPGEITVTMHYTVELPGYTGAVTADGKAPKPVLDCCIKVIEDLKFPEFRGTKVERELAFTWTKREKGVDGGAGAAPKK